MREARAEEVPARMWGVHKRFGKIEALKGIELEVRSGEVVALLGPNGAGKTTAVNILLGLRRPDRGEALLFGGRPTAPRSRRAVGATPQAMSFPLTLRVREVIELVQAHYVNPVSVDEVMERFGLVHLDRRQSGGLSGGERRRLAVALAFCGNPKAVFLDEPTTGLDVDSRRKVWQGIREYMELGGTVLLTTHYLDEAEALASRIVVMSGGRLRAEGNVAQIKAMAGTKRVRFRARSLPDFPGAAQVSHNGGSYTVCPEDADQFVSWLVREQVPFADLEVLPASLEEAFLTLTGSDE